MSVIEELRQNDPARTTCYILLHRETDADLAQALEQNPFVADIGLNLEGVQQTDWDSLRRVIATRANLENVELLDAGHPEERTAPAGLVRAFLHAIQQNTAIRSVAVCWLCLPTDISTFVDNASSIASFRLFDCDMEPGERGQSARDLAAALRRNTNIESLQLWHLDDLYAIPILEGLQLRTSVKTFVFSPCVSFSDAAAHALQRLLESTTSIQKFELRHFRDESLIRPIAQAITSSESVSELKFVGSRFEDQSSLAQLRSILQNKRNLTSLCFHHCGFGGAQVHGDIISLLLRPDSQLRCFEFHNYRWPLEFVDGVFRRIPFEALLRAIEKSKLERFKIGRIETPHQLQTLTQSIPSMKLKELDVGFYHDDGSDDEDDEEEGEFDQETIRQGLLQAVKNNFSLHTVKGEIEHRHESDDLFGGAEDKQRLAFYANRNESLDQWVDHPETVQQKVWPDALGLAERAGPNALFRGLRSVLGSDYVHLPGGRKRKRTQHYSPS